MKKDSSRLVFAFLFGTVVPLFAALSVTWGAGCVGETRTSPQAPPPPTARPVAALNQVEKTCSAVPLVQAQENLAYCFADPVGQAHGAAATVTILYYLHGFGGSADDLFDGNARPLLDAILQIMGNNAPIFAALSLGSAGIFVDDTGEILSAGLPAVDAAIAPGKAVRRIVMGVSMGGHNALRLGGEGGSARFQAVAALCPALATFNGYDDTEVDAYRARHADVLDTDLFNRAIVAFKLRIKDAAAWNANNPFTFLSRGSYENMPLFMSVGTEDTLGFFEGTREFLRRADGLPSMNIDYHEVSGKHCAFDVPTLLRFLAMHGST